MIWPFIGRLIGWYLGLLLLWLPLGHLYRAGLIGAGNLTLGKILPGKEILFQHHTQEKALGITEGVDLVVLVRTDDMYDRDHHKQYVLAKPVITFYQPYTAAAFLGALFLAGRPRWRTRLLKGVPAMAGLHCLMLVCVLVEVNYTIGLHLPAASSQGPWVKTACQLLHSSVTDWSAGVFLVPLILWTLSNWPARRSGGTAEKQQTLQEDQR